MKESQERLRQLESCQWARCVGAVEASAGTCGPIERIAGQLEDDPDEFLMPPYRESYESLCLLDHERAASLSCQVDSERASRIVRAAYLATWQILPVPEVCGLVSDDAETLATLLLANVELTPFSRDRLGWYLAGRIPFGYVGEYPEGRWIVL